MLRLLLSLTACLAPYRAEAVQDPSESKSIRENGAYEKRRHFQLPHHSLRNNQ